MYYGCPCTFFFCLVCNYIGYAWYYPQSLIKLWYPTLSSYYVHSAHNENCTLHIAPIYLILFIKLHIAPLDSILFIKLHIAPLDSILFIKLHITPLYSIFFIKLHITPLDSILFIKFPFNPLVMFNL